MEFVKLRYLIAVAEQRSFSKAAEKCFVSQPTLTRCVQNMEKSLGVSLFDRSCSPIQLTPAGEKYVAGVREILALKEKLDNEMAELTDRRQEVLSIGIPLTRSITWLGRILPAIYAQCPGVKLQITEGYSGELTKKLLEGEITFCLMACSSSQVKGVTLRPVYQEEMMLVIDRNADALQGVDFPPREKGTLQYISPRMLEKLLFICAPPTQDTWHFAAGVFRRLGIQPKRVMETPNSTVAYQLAAQDGGFAFAPVAVSLEEDFPSNPIFASPTMHPLCRSVGISYREDDTLSENAAAFLEIAAREIGQFARSHTPLFSVRRDDTSER